MKHRIAVLAVAVAFAAVVFSVSPPRAVAGNLSAGGATSAAAMTPKAVVVRVDEVGDSCGLPAFCEAVVSFMKRIVSASYMLVGSDAAPDPQRIARSARMVYELLSSSSLLRRG